MKKYTLYNIIRRSVLTLCMMVSATMAWAVEVSTAADLATLLSQSRSEVVDIKLTQDIALTSTINIEHSVTIDLNGHNITADGFRAFWVKIGENVEFKSDKPAAITAGGAISASSSVIRIGDNSGTLRNVKLTIGENVTVHSEICYGITVFGTNTTETLIVDGRISTTNYPAIGGNGNPGNGNTTITINKDAEVSSVHELAIYHPQYGQLSVYGTVTGAGGIEMKAGNLTVGPDAHISATAAPVHNSYSGGSSTLGYAIALVENGDYPAGLGTINISQNAEIDGAVAVLKDNASTDTHPTFDPVGVQMNVSVTKDGDIKKYASLHDALEEAPEGASVQLLNDIALSRVAEVVSANITIDLNGHNVTATGDRAFWVKKAGTSITGAGTISATGIVNPDWSVIQVGNEAEATSLTVGDNVTISTNDCYGITTIGTAVSSLTVNGKVATKVRPAIYSTGSFNTTVGSAANITTTEEGAIYSTGASLTVSGTVSGLSAVETKSGTLTIDGATLTATGTPSHTPNNNGTSTRGYAVAMVKNSNFTTVSKADFTGTNTITGPVATLIDSGTDADPAFTGITMLADINGEHYSSVIDATNIVPSDGTVKLMANIALTAPLVLVRHASYRLDLDGYNVTATDCGAFVIKSGDIIITTPDTKPATISSTGNVASTDAVIRLGDNAGENRNLSLGINEKVTVSTTKCNGILLSGTNTRESLTVKGTISTEDQPAIVGDKANGGTTINIGDNADVTSANNVAVYHPQTGTLTVEGSEGHNASVSGTTGIEMKAGDLIVGEHAVIAATATSATHTASNEAPSTSGYGIAIIENAYFEGVGNVDIETTEHITAPVSVAKLVDSAHPAVAEPEFIGNVMIVAQVTDTNTDKYAKLEDAIKQAQNGNTVKMLEDATVTAALNITQPIVFDLNDYTITSALTSGYVIHSSANATIKDGGIIANNCGGVNCTAGELILQKVNMKVSANSMNIAGATASIDNTSMLTSTSSKTIVVGDRATLTVNGKIYNTTTDAIQAANGTEDASLTIGTGAIVSASSGTAINWQNTGTLTINAGQIMGQTAVHAEKGTVNINGGTLTGTANAFEVVKANVGDCTVYVEHGTFNSGSGDPIVSSGASAATKFVKGDYFSKQIQQTLCVDGYMISSGKNNNGMYYLISELVITDGTSWTVPGTTYTIHKAKYIRNSGMGTAQYGTLCLPFSFHPDYAGTTIPAGMKFYKVIRIAGDILYLDELSGEVEAGTPVIFHRTGSETSFTIECEDASIPASGPKADTTNGLKGTFSNVNFDSGLDTKYYLNGDHFHQADTKLTVPAFRAYIDTPTVSSAKPRVLRIQTDNGEADAIGNVFDDSDPKAVYDIQGRKLDALQSGMNIVKMANGKTIKVYLNK